MRFVYFVLHLAGLVQITSGIPLPSRHILAMIERDNLGKVPGEDYVPVTDAPNTTMISSHLKPLSLQYVTEGRSINESQSIEQSDSTSTTLKWNEASKWGVISIIAAIVISILGFLAKSIVRCGTARTRRSPPDIDTANNHDAPQNTSHHGASPYIFLLEWLIGMNNSPSVETLGVLPTDQELQVVPRLASLDFDRGTDLDEWLPPMPLAHLRVDSDIQGQQYM